MPGNDDDFGDEEVSVMETIVNVAIDAMVVGSGKREVDAINCFFNGGVSTTSIRIEYDAYVNIGYGNTTYSSLAEHVAISYDRAEGLLFSNICFRDDVIFKLKPRQLFGGLLEQWEAAIPAIVEPKIPEQVFELVSKALADASKKYDAVFLEKVKQEEQEQKAADNEKIKRRAAAITGVDSKKDSSDSKAEKAFTDLNKLCDDDRVLDQVIDNQVDLYEKVTNNPDGVEQGLIDIAENKVNFDPKDNPAEKEFFTGSD